MMAFTATVQHIRNGGQMSVDNLQDHLRMRLLHIKLKRTGPYDNEYVIDRFLY